jgi:hypothetical protein
MTPVPAVAPAWPPARSAPLPSAEIHEGTGQP